MLQIFGLDSSVTTAKPITTIDKIVPPSVAQPRIIGGTDVAPGTFPFLASLLGSFNGHSCGGTLIAPDLVLSAAHCTGLTGAQVGRSNREDKNDDYEEFELLQEIRHPGYFDGYFQYDFMILLLDGQSTKQTVILNQDEDLPSPGVEHGVKAIGFGVTEYNSDGSYGQPAIILQQADMTAIANAECEQSKDPDALDEAYRNGYQGMISPEMLCAKGNNVDSCVGGSWKVYSYSHQF
jgi:secreted trypsin-like serine protease